MSQPNSTVLPLEGAAAIEVVHTTEVLGKPFQIYGTKENPLFRAKDVASWIEHSDVSTMLRTIDEDEKVTNIVCTLGGSQKSWFLTEYGLYEVLMQSRKPIAKQFKKQVKEILHEIRTSGGYIHATPEMSESEIMAKALLVAQTTIERSKAQLAEANRQLIEQAPAVEYCNEVLAAQNLHTVNSVAVQIGISAIKLNKFLMDEQWIYKQGGLYYPAFKIRSKGYATFQVVPYLNSNGERMTREHLKWTELGRRAIIELWNKRHAA